MSIIDDLIKKGGQSFIENKLGNIINQASNTVNNGQNAFDLLKQNNKSSNSVADFINRYKNNVFVKSFLDSKGINADAYENYFRGNSQNNSNNNSKYDLNRFNK